MYGSRRGNSMAEVEVEAKVEVKEEGEGGEDKGRKGGGRG